MNNNLLYSPMLYRVMSMEMTNFRFDLELVGQILLSSILDGMLMICLSPVPQCVVERLFPVDPGHLELWSIPMEVGHRHHLDMQMGPVTSGQRAHMFQ